MLDDLLLIPSDREGNKHRPCFKYYYAGQLGMGVLLSPAEDDLQLNLDLVARRRHLLTSGLWVDVQFEIGDSRIEIKAHRQILASASPVFRAMLYGPWTERESPVRVPDISPETFNIMLEFIYTDTIEPVPLEKLPDIDYVSKKYLIPRLMKACTDPFIEALDADNVVECYECASAMEYQPFIDECVKIFSSHTKEVLEAENSVHYDMGTLLFIFSLDDLSLQSEIELLDFVEKFAKANENEEGDQSQSIRPLLQRIRFLSLTPKELSKRNHRLRDFLSEGEILSLLLNVCSRDVMPLPDGFSTNRSIRCEAAWIDKYVFFNE